MGGKGSRAIALTDDDLNFLATRCGLSSSDIRKLTKSFKKFDIGKDGKLQYDEFCVRMRCEPTELLLELFTFFGSRSRSTIPYLAFMEFAVFVCYFLTLSEEEVAEFLFLILTSDASSLTPVTSVPSPVFADRMRGVLGSVDAHFIARISQTQNKRTFVTQDIFVDTVCSKNKSVLFPLIAYQLDMKNRIGINKDFWADLPRIVHGNILIIRKDLRVLLSREAGHSHAATEDIDVNLEEDS